MRHSQSSILLELTSAHGQALDMTDSTVDTKTPLRSLTLHEMVKQGRAFLPHQRKNRKKVKRASFPIYASTHLCLLFLQHALSRGTQRSMTFPRLVKPLVCKSSKRTEREQLKSVDPIHLSNWTDGDVACQVKFHPTRPQLFVASRRHNAITCWDVRQAAVPLTEYSRPAQTNQRLFFDVEASGRFLAAGDQVCSLVCLQVSSDRVYRMGPSILST